MPRGDRIEPLQQRSAGLVGTGIPSLPQSRNDTGDKSQREYNKFQTRANEPGARLAEQWAFDMQRGRDQWPWNLDVTRTGQPRGQYKNEGQWNVKSSNFKPPTMWARNEEQDSGVMTAAANNPMVMQAKNLYNKIDPWIPNMDFGDEEIGYEWEKPLLGGTLGYGFDYDWDDEDVGAFINWKLGLGA
jgi:hypothetical protein